MNNISKSRYKVYIKRPRNNIAPYLYADRTEERTDSFVGYITVSNGVMSFNRDDLKSRYTKIMDLSNAVRYTIHVYSLPAGHHYYIYGKRRNGGKWSSIENGTSDTTIECDSNLYGAIRICVKNESDDTQEFNENFILLLLESAYPTMIHDNKSPNQNDHLVNPVLDLADSESGSFSFVLPRTHPYYKTGIDLFTDTVYVTRSYLDNTYPERIIWDGRPIVEEVDTYGNKQYTCEGALAYLNDFRTTDLDTVITGATPSAYIETHIIGGKNTESEKVKISDRTFYGAYQNGEYLNHISTDGFDGTTYRWYLTRQSGLQALNDIKENFGAHYKIRYRKYDTPFNDTICRSFTMIQNLETCNRLSTLKTRFGEDIFDIKMISEFDNFATKIIPIGAEVLGADGNMSNLLLNTDHYYTESTDDNGEITREKILLAHYNTLWVENLSLIRYYGIIEAAVSFENALTPTKLYNSANAWFENIKENIVKRTITMSLLDLEGAVTTSDPDPYTDPEYIDIWTKVEAEIPQFGITSDKPEIYYVTALSIPLDDPLNTDVTLANKANVISESKITAGDIMAQPAKGIIDSSS